MSIALITGATSGFGKATAIRFAEHGYNVIITGRRQDRLNELEDYIKENFEVDVLTLCFDVRNREETINELNAIPHEWKDVTVLVNNAGLAAGLSTIQDGDIDDWETMIDTNLKGLLYVTRTVSPWMIKNNKENKHRDCISIYERIYIIIEPS